MPRPRAGDKTAEPGGRLFLVEWDREAAAARADGLRRLGWQVEVESEDGASAYRRIREAPPAAVIIIASTRPSHGAETGRSLREVKATRALPILFVDADDAARERISGRVADARFISSSELPAALAGLGR